MTTKYMVTSCHQNIGQNHNLLFAFVKEVKADYNWECLQPFYSESCPPVSSLKNIRIKI